MRTSFLLAFAFMLPNIASGQIFGPKTYEDCILESVTTSRTDSAFGAIYEMCERKFPQSKRTTTARLPSVSLGTGKPVSCTFPRGTYQDVSFRVSHSRINNVVIMRFDNLNKDSSVNFITKTGTRLIFDFLNSKGINIRAEVNFMDGTFDLRDGKSAFNGVCEELLH